MRARLSEESPMPLLLNNPRCAETARGIRASAVHSAAAKASRRFVLVTAGALIAARLGFAQPASARPRVVGLLEYGTAAAFERQLAAFEQGLRDSGFERGRNLLIEARYAEDDYRKLSRLAEDLVRSKVEVIYAPLAWSVQAAKDTRSAIPIVFSGVNDPVALNFVKSLARPGGAITGVTVVSHELTAKRVELMRELFPLASRVGVIYDEEMARACQIEVDDITAASKRLGVEVRRFPYVTRADLPGAFGEVQRNKIAALLVPTTLETRRVGAELAAHLSTAQVPMMHAGSAPVEAGGLMSYGPPAGWAERRAAQYVARILNGVRPDDLPVETPRTYELVINLKVARAMGVAIPNSILLRATRVIELQRLRMPTRWRRDGRVGRRARATALWCHVAVRPRTRFMPRRGHSAGYRRCASRVRPRVRLSLSAASSTCASVPIPASICARSNAANPSTRPLGAGAAMRWAESGRVSTPAATA